MLFAAPALRARDKSERQSTIQLNIASDGDNLAFVPNRLRCISGRRVRLHLHHAGEILDDPHDWVLLKPGMQGAFLADADRQQDEQQPIPPQDANMIIAATPLCPRGKTVTVTFIAPAPGDYPFVCSIPGHGQTMHGILTVTREPT
jgi:azurin